MWGCRFEITGLLSRRELRRRRRAHRAALAAQQVARIAWQIGPLGFLAIFGTALLLRGSGGSEVTRGSATSLRILSVSSPSGQSVFGRLITEPSVVVTGEVQEHTARQVFLDVNGSIRSVTVDSGVFRHQVGVIAGQNRIRASLDPRFGFARTVSANFVAAIPHAAIRAELTWEGPGDIDIHMMDPGGEDCFFGHKQTKTGAMLDFDNTVSDGPENITLERAPAGTYRIAVVYYAGTQRPVAWTVRLRLHDRTLHTFSGILTQLKEAQDVVSFQMP